MSLYHEAVTFLSSSSSDGGSLKARIFRKKDLKSSPNQLYALVLETCKWSPVLKEIIDRSGLLNLERKLTPELSLLLVHDLLLARGGIALPQSHGLRASIERHKGRLTSELTLARLRRKAPSVDALKEQVQRASAGEEANYPRWVRVNALKSTVEEQLETTFLKYERAESIRDVVTYGAKRLYIDPNVPNLLAVTQGTDLIKTEAYTSGKVILQDKASCFPAYLLDPQAEDGDVVDACAAPGNKTTHLAAILHNHLPEFESAKQVIYAFEKDSKRAQTLEKMVRIAGSKELTRIAFGQDFLQSDPHSERFTNVGALLLDPSCSGSGIVGRDSMPELHLPEATTARTKGPAGPSKNNSNKRKRKNDDVDEGKQNIMVDDDGNETVVKSEKDLAARLEALASFQLHIILHAFQFPSAKKVTYSTCSVHEQENEGVVMRALESDLAKARGWRILERSQQVSGMRDWPVRGLAEACNGDETVSEGCIRSYKDDGRGVMGFFVAGFIRSGEEGNSTNDNDDGPYVRDEDGRIIRDALGMPVEKATGVPVALNGREIDEPESDVSEEDNDEEEADVDEESGDNGEDAVSEGDEEEWNGFGS
ncbi:25S rRNA (cytosine-C(5))-methyltransferase rcm1 [Paramyrothecium foliicola]|nr:25S rRNA (cytosine-C(5))-methyltransferase rcm1 [Paramyrothecium foliicola]